MVVLELTMRAQEMNTEVSEEKMRRHAGRQKMT